MALHRSRRHRLDRRRCTSLFGAAAQPCQHDIRTLRPGRRMLRRRVLLFAGDLPGLRRRVRPLTGGRQSDRGRVRRRYGQDRPDLRRGLGGRDGPRPRVRRDRPRTIAPPGRRRTPPCRSSSPRSSPFTALYPARSCSATTSGTRRRRPLPARPARCRVSARAWSGRPGSSSRRSWHAAGESSWTPGEPAGRSRASATCFPPDRIDDCTAGSHPYLVTAIGYGQQPAIASSADWQGPR